MKIKRKPLQIFFVEHVFFPLLGFIFLALSYNYGIKIAVRYSDMPPHHIGALIGLLLLLVSSFCLYVLMPYTCIRLWISANTYLQGYKKAIAKLYAGVLIIILAYFGLGTLSGIPGAFEAFKILTAEY